MRVLHLIASLGQGGAERQLSLLAPAMARMGVDVGVCFHTGGVNLHALENDGSELFALPSRSNHDPRLVLDLNGVMKRFRPDIVQTWLLQMDVLGGAAARWRGVPHVLSERSSSAMYAPGGWKLRARAAMGRRASAIIANSEGGLDYWRALGAQGEMRVIRNALTPPRGATPLDDLGLGGRRLLVAAGRLSHEKNVPVLIASLACALQLLPEHHAVIFGDGPEREASARLIARSGAADRLHLGGYTDSLSWWLQRADAFLSASLIEGHPNVVIEAAAVGCPLVLSDIPAHREFAVGDSALFANTSDVQAFAQALVETVQKPSDAVTRARRARAHTEALGVDGAARRHIELYRSVLNSAPQP